MGKNGKSFIYPANEIEIISSLEEPLIKQQIEWNIRQVSFCLTFSLQFLFFKKYSERL